ncbi:MAG: hypothetical protein J7K51_02330 [Thermotogae bacterium]|nr:hypothetical protein [Thermotogota bacterium]
MLRSLMKGDDKQVKTIEIKVPEKLESIMKEYVKEGWFKDESDIILYSLTEFIHRNETELTEKFMEEDIKWALKQKKE